MLVKFKPRDKGESKAKIGNSWNPRTSSCRCIWRLQCGIISCWQHRLFTARLCYYGAVLPRRRPHYVSMLSVCLPVRPSVRLSVPCLHLEGKRKGLRIPNLVGRISGTRAPRGPISRSKGQRSRSRRLKARSPRSVVKSKWFTRWQHLLSPCGSTHVLNCKDGLIASLPSTAAHSCCN